ncbi:hypothetical protein ACU4GR_30190 [Methylobacterium oryzae CBMB20]
MAKPRPGRRRVAVAALVGSALAILAAAAHGRPADASVSAEAADALGVITPVPSTLGADPGRSAIGRLLFTDTRLSRGATGPASPATTSAPAARARCPGT